MFSNKHLFVRQNGNLWEHVVTTAGKEVKPGMKNIFGEDGLVYRVTAKAVDLIVLNLLFLVTCIPVVTIGAAQTALYSVTLKMCRNEESYLVKSYWKYFRANLKCGTVAWLICAVISLVLTADFLILWGTGSEMGQILQILVFAVALLAVMVLSYIFPLTAMFENTVSNTFKNAMIISMTRIVYTIPITVINLVPVVLLLCGGKALACGISVYFMIGFALGAYLNSFLLRKVFERYI